MKNSKENRTTDFEKSVILKPIWNLLDHTVSTSDCNITQNGFVTNGAKKFMPENVSSQKANRGFPA